MDNSQSNGVADERDAFSLKGKKVWVAGHRGMVGSALVKRLSSEDCNVIWVERDLVDLRNQAAVNDWVAQNKPDAVFLAAAKVGGIFANDSKPAEFLFDNLAIASNIIDAAYKNGTEKLLFLGSSCIYPRLSPQPMMEEHLLTGPLEPTNEWYAIAKIAGLKMCEAYARQYGANFISAMPTNLYGEGDNFDLKNSHVLPALIKKIHNAKINGENSVVIWGSGTPKREFMHVDDLADSLVFLMKNYRSKRTINVGTGDEVSIGELGNLIAQIIGFEGGFTFDTSKPDGTPRKLLDVSRLRNLGWNPDISLQQGIERVFEWYQKNVESGNSDIRH